MTQNTKRLQLLRVLGLVLAFVGGVIALIAWPGTEIDGFFEETNPTGSVGVAAPGESATGRPNHWR
jgi:hypothetical protein